MFILSTLEDDVRIAPQVGDHRSRVGLPAAPEALVARCWGVCVPSRALQAHLHVVRCLLQQRCSAPPCPQLAAAAAAAAAATAD